MSDSTSVPSNPFTLKDWERNYAIEAASKEAQKSKLPGREEGPADAYRHLLWAGEFSFTIPDDSSGAGRPDERWELITRA